MIEISEKLRTAIKEAATDAGNPYQLSLKIGVVNATVLKWISGQTVKIYEGTFLKLLPLVAPHLDKQEIEHYCAIFEYIVDGYHLDLARMDESCINEDKLQEKLYYAEEALKKLQFLLNMNHLDKTLASLAIPKTQNTDPGPAEAIPVREANVQFRAVPVLSFAQAAGYEPALEPLCDYLRETSDRTALFFDVADNCFALEVSGDSMAPDYPNGSIALVSAGDYPQRGDIVAAKLNDGQVVIKEYHRCNNIITLQSINPDGKNFEWHCKEQPGYVQWMWPVIEVILKPRDRRWAQRRMGV